MQTHLKTVDLKNLEPRALDAPSSIVKEERLKGYLEIVTNVAVLLVALLILGKFAWTYFSERPSPSTQVQAGLRKGGQFSLLPKVDYSKRGQTLVIAMSSACERCNESVPFIQQVLRANTEKGDKTQIVAIFPENAEQVARYISDQRISLNAVPGIDIKAINLPGTPTAVLVSSEGTIINFWIGKPSTAAEQEILKYINL